MSLLIVIAAAVVVVSLDREPLKGLILDAIAARSGITVDFEAIDIGVSGLDLRGLRVLPPPADQDHVTAVLAVDDVSVSWDLAALLTGAVDVREVRIDGVTLHSLVDADGSSTLSRLLEQLPVQEEKPEPTPLSHALAGLRGLPSLQCRALTATNVTVKVGLRGPSGKVRELKLDGLDTKFSAELGAELPIMEASVRMSESARVRIAPDPSFNVAAATPSAEAIAKYLRSGLDTRVAGLFEVKVTRNQRVTMHLSAGPRQPWLLAGRHVARVISSDLELRFEPDRERVRAILRKAQLLGDLAAASGVATVRDTPAAGIEMDVDEARAHADITPFATFLPPAFGVLSATQLHGEMLVRKITGIGSGKMPKVSEIDLSAKVKDLRYALAGRTIALADAAMELAAFPGPHNTVRIHMTAPVRDAQFRDKAAATRLTVRSADLRADVGALRLDPSDPFGARVELSASATTDWIEAVAGAASVTVTSAAPTLQLAIGQRRVHMTAELDGFGLSAHTPDADMAATNLSVSATIADLPLDIAHGLGSSVVSGSVAASKVTGHGAGQTFSLGHPKLTAEFGGIAIPPFAPLVGIASTHLEASAKTASSSAFGALSKLHARLAGRVFKMDPAKPEGATGELTAHMDVGTATFKLDLKRSGATLPRGNPVSWDAKAYIPKLGKLIGGLKLRRDIRKLAQWDRLGLDMTTAGKVTNLGGRGSPRFEHRESVTAHGLVAKLGSFKTTVPLAIVSVEGTSAGPKHEVRLGASLAGLRLATYDGAGKHALTGRLIVDLSRPEVTFEAGVVAANGPKLKAHGHAVLRNGNDLQWQMDGELGRLGLIAKALPRKLKSALCVDLARLQTTLKSSGNLRTSRAALLNGSLVRNMTAGRVPDLSAMFAASGTGLRCRKPSFFVEIPSFSGDVKVAVARQIVRADATLSAAKLRFDFGKLHGEATGLRQLVQLKTERLAKALGKTTISTTADLGTLTQSAMPEYPIADATLAMDLSHLHGADIRIEKFALLNKGAGSEMSLSGGVQLPLEGRLPLGNDGLAPRVGGRHALAVVGELKQDLGKLVAHEDRLTASGSITVPFRVESGDLSVIRTSAQLNFHDVAVAIPALELAAVGVQGNVPLLEDIELVEGRVRLLGGGANNAYARWRFSDQHPFLGGDHFVSVREVRFREMTFGPVAANASLDRNVMHLDQMEMNVAGGKVTGSSVINIDGKQTEVLFRGNITGVQAGESKERLDANAAINIRPAQLSIGGRAEVLRLAPAHLRAVLDMWDPYREDDRANRLRLALHAGYPKRMRMMFSHGFADFLIELGGLGSVVQIDEVKGVAMGPVMARFAAPFIRKSMAFLEGMQ